MRNNKKMLYLIFIFIQIQKKNTFEMLDIISEKRIKAEEKRIKAKEKKEKEIILNENRNLPEKKIQNSNKILLKEKQINKNDLKNDYKDYFRKKIDKKIIKFLKTLEKFRIKKNEIFDFIQFIKIGINLENSKSEKNLKKEKKIQFKNDLFHDCKLIINRILKEYKNMKNFVLKDLLEKILLKLFRNRFNYCFEK